MVTMHDGNLSRILKLSNEKRMTPERWTAVLASPIFAAILDERANLSKPDMVLVALGLSIKKSRPRRSKVLAGLLELVGEPIKFCGAERFVPRDKFVSGHGNGDLPISRLSNAFICKFFGLVEVGVQATTLKQRTLLKSRVDGPIISALGGEENARIHLAHVFEFLLTANHGISYIFYVVDVNGILSSVSARWIASGWDLEAFALKDPLAWGTGSHVVSR